jgi:hypothetical protein
MIISSSICFPADAVISFFMAESYSIVYICHIFFIYSSIEGHLGWFQSLAVALPLELCPKPFSFYFVFKIGLVSNLWSSCLNLLCS